MNLINMRLLNYLLVCLYICLINGEAKEDTEEEVLEKTEENEKPNIIFIMVDDVGWTDFNYNTPGLSSIPTPNIDRLAEQGIKLKTHYVHPTCTPSRAAFMTGRYSANTGLPFAMYPGSVAGLPPDMPTLPQLLRKAGYSAHMVGKWHLGHSQPKQGPIGRGFESHTGSHMWDLESYTKLMWDRPWTTPYGADWIKAHENGSFLHFPETRHSTIALTEEAVTVIEDHKANDKPLFLYLSYNAAHSPLQPEDSWLTDCLAIPHLWRRQYCGMVVGLDWGIKKVVDVAKEALGDNTVIVVSSDNGGSVWFGGLNQPLRSGKHTSFEGGVRVPAFAVDLSGGKYFGSGGREFRNIVHISDWLPTFLSLAKSSHLIQNINLDGVDQSGALVTGGVGRSSVLLDLYTSADSHDGRNLAAYRHGPFKVILGSYKDSHWYSEPSADQVSTSDQGILARFFEHVARAMDWVFGEGPCDNFRMLMFNLWLFNHYAKTVDPTKPLLFNVEEDPEEKHDLAEKMPDVVEKLLKEVKEIEKKRPRQPKYWLISRNWTDGFQKGDCSGQSVLKEEYCVFTNSWLSDDANLEDEDSLGLVDIAAEVNTEVGVKLMGILAAFVLFSILLTKLLRTGKVKTN